MRIRRAGWDGFAHLLDRVTLHPGTLENYASLLQVVAGEVYDECYHLAAQSFVADVSFEDGFSTMNTNVNGTHYMLAALRECGPRCRFYFAALERNVRQGRRDAADGRPRRFTRAAHTPSAKSTGFELTRNYREAYGMFCCSGILFNHEAPRRGFEFVTRKITTTVARIKLGLATELRLGNLDVKRDWGHAADYVRAMPLMLQHAEADDYVVATGESHSVREFCELAFAAAGLDYRDFVKVDERLYRPAEVYSLTGDAEKARRVLGWKPTRTFRDLVAEMVGADMEALAGQKS